MWEESDWSGAAGGNEVPSDCSESVERRELGGQRRGRLGGRQGASREVMAGAGLVMSLLPEMLIG